MSLHFFVVVVFTLMVYCAVVESAIQVGPLETNSNRMVNPNTLNLRTNTPTKTMNALDSGTKHPDLNEGGDDSTVEERGLSKLRDLFKKSPKLTNSKTPADAVQIVKKNPNLINDWAKKSPKFRNIKAEPKKLTKGFVKDFLDFLGALAFLLVGFLVSIGGGYLIFK
ncbi:hypothetical protein JG687_00019422 [Phytophthora cactorum]|uniref:RxLR effector protein n=1 Tax=Phytophthora cactorum TaxID=29920 RepID=A0A329RXY9_9STRA|nr:hypothetical protein Pcac1_g6760 [Phytophthora cactorum]KAG2988819.1 hypothetical protein PC119_g19466 [Phytophthora cactorum]KAG3214094.1 hypothetical protein PC129_g14991 [Phytophthora cactorum]KAG6941830.1 hypothetical protein JG687_00019422 [Phytophthora cactorum]RAW29547.1 hypothetical protein PC110_g14087 [Phytophthora cactorum]